MPLLRCCLPLPACTCVFVPFFICRPRCRRGGDGGGNGGFAARRLPFSSHPTIFNSILDANHCGNAAAGRGLDMPQVQSSDGAGWNIEVRLYPHRTPTRWRRRRALIRAVVAWDAPCPRGNIQHAQHLTGYALAGNTHAARRRRRRWPAVPHWRTPVACQSVVQHAGWQSWRGICTSVRVGRHHGMGVRVLVWRVWVLCAYPGISPSPLSPCHLPLTESGSHSVSPLSVHAGSHSHLPSQPRMACVPPHLVRYHTARGLPPPRLYAPSCCGCDSI